jgi:hypothetical protein
VPSRPDFSISKCLLLASNTLVRIPADMCQAMHAGNLWMQSSSMAKAEELSGFLGDLPRATPGFHGEVSR